MCPSIRLFALTSAAQSRAPGPAALTSAAYAADFNETRSMGGATSTSRTAEQSVGARFHTEAPPVFWTRNLRPFIMTNRPLADQARLGGLLWVVHADATIACFESKYFFLAWRPFSAITPIKARVTSEDGKSFVAENKPGTAFWEGAVTHSVENIGGSGARAYMIELKA
jgi:hypothetical protein